MSAAPKAILLSSYPSTSVQIYGCTDEARRYYQTCDLHLRNAISLHGLLFLITGLDQNGASRRNVYYIMRRPMYPMICLRSAQYVYDAMCRQSWARHLPPTHSPRTVLPAMTMSGT